MRSRSRRTGLGAAALAAWVGLACADPVSPGTQVCAEILAFQVPGAELVEAWPGAHGVALDYRVPGEDAAGVHRIQCGIAEPEQGRAAAAQRGEAERSAGPREGGRAAAAQRGEAERSAGPREGGGAAAAQRAGAPVELGQAERSGGFPPEPGRLRAHSVRLDGRELSEAELVLVNSELLLAEIRRADPGPQRPPPWEATLRGLRGGASRIEATLSRLTREALSSLDAWWRPPRQGTEDRAGAPARV